MEPEHVRSAFYISTRWGGSPLSTMSALRVLPLGFNSCLEAVKICACTELAGLSHIIVYAAKLYTIATGKK